MSAPKEALSRASGFVPSDGRGATAYEEIIQIYLRDVDRSLIRQNLTLTPAQRLQKLEEFVEFLQSAKNSRGLALPTEKDAKPI